VAVVGRADKRKGCHDSASSRQTIAMATQKGGGKQQKNENVKLYGTTREWKDSGQVIQMGRVVLYISFSFTWGLCAVLLTRS
jgi:hypothetical protein